MPVNLDVIRNLIQIASTDLSEFVESSELYLTQLKDDALFNDFRHQELSRQMGRCMRTRHELINLGRILDDGKSP